MSAIAFERGSSPSISGLRILFQRLLSRIAQQDRSLETIRSLPDHLLLDIGIDPRTVRIRGALPFYQSEAFDSDMTALHFRTIAKS